MKKVAIFIRWLAMGGVQRWAVNLSRGLVERGYAVDLVLGNAAGPLLEEVDPRVNVVDLNSRYLLFALPQIAAYMNKHKPSIFLTAQPFTNTLALLGQKLANHKSPIVISEHVRVEDFLRDKKWFGRLLYPWAASIVAVSKGVAVDLEKVMHLPRKKITVIHNPVVNANLQERAASPIRLPWADKQSYALILGAGRLVGQKDFPTLIKAFAQVVKHRSARLLILGEGECRSELEKQIHDLNLGDYAKLHGFAKNPYPYMKAADVFVSSSKFEGLAYVLVEALANGTSVVSTDCPHGPRDILEDGKYGRLVPVRDVQALAQAIGETLDRPLSPQLLIERSKDFTVDRITGEYSDLFESLLNKGYRE